MQIKINVLYSALKTCSMHFCVYLILKQRQAEKHKMQVLNNNLISFTWPVGKSVYLLSYHIQRTTKLH